MALSVAALQALLDSLITARAKGLRTVTDQNSESVTFKSDTEMARAIADLEARIEEAQTGRRRPTVIKFTASKFGD